MTSELNLLESQDFKYMLEEDPIINDFMQGNMGILQEEEPDLPDQYPHVPTSDDFVGDYNFEAVITPTDNKNFLYSEVLNKMFTVNQRNFTIDFRWNNESRKDFFIRAMPIYSSAQDANKPVQCCIQHRVNTERYNEGRTKLTMYHILRSIHNQAQYTGGRERHLSVVVPLGTPQAGMDIVRHTFFFVCKNSCATGINRRAVDLIFTLEDIDGNILGRRKISVRVCSCPKRDKMKEEEEYLKNSGQPAQRGKKRKFAPKKSSSFSDPNDNKVYSINIEVVGKKNSKAVLNYARSLMATEVVDRDGEEPFNRCFNQLTEHLRNHD